LTREITVIAFLGRLGLDPSNRPSIEALIVLNEW